jgi:hypothetical protein
MDYTITCARCKADVTHRCNTELVAWAIRLLKWRPESGFPEQLKKDNVYLPDKETKNEIDSPEIPFMSEAFLYPLLGKEDARTLMALVDHLLAGVGLDPSSIQNMAYAEIEKDRQQRLEAEERQKKYLERRRQRKTQGT